MTQAAISRRAIPAIANARSPGAIAANPYGNQDSNQPNG